MQHNSGFMKLVEEARKRIKECTVEDVQAKLTEGIQFHFIDVREDHEFLTNHAAGARHLGKGIIERDIETAIPDKNTPIILYCGGGYRSALVADTLQLMGYKSVLSLVGGIKALRDAGFPLERNINLEK
ncbi:Rhodanese-related sulfurtransferase [Nitrosomonas ureae]|uniref:Rhodanese-related sulfurtransferase n=2 Tax=Nitrosomonas ureae TaxID=44577 RepID=A0A1H5UWY5_9PROT|nr:Rhodanese-related sulfurtransferase [Nitrosomonas ureae]